MSTKQIIVVRRDLNMPPGKLAAQVAHAGGLWLQRRLRLGDVVTPQHEGEIVVAPYIYTAELSEAEHDWLSDNYTKVVVEVPDEATMHALKVQASEADLTVHVVRDLGRTVFKGVRTATCLAVGPDTAEKLDPLFRHLPLYK